MKALLIHHKGAGVGGVAASALAKALREAGWKVRCLPRKKADGKKIASAKADLIVAAGGDGTVARVMTLLPDRSTPLAIIPTGTANDIAVSLGITGEPEALIAGWDPDRRRRIDIGNAHGPWGRAPFAEGVGFGAFAESLRRAPHVDGDEKLAAGRAAFDQALAEAEPLPLEIELDGKKMRGGFLFVEAMNMPVTGPRLRLAPEAEPGDGRLHLSWLPAVRRAAMRDWLADGGKGDAPVEQASGREAVVRGGGVMIRIDDESRWLEEEAEIRLRLEGAPVQILAPPEKPALAG